MNAINIEPSGFRVKRLHIFPNASEPVQRDLHTRKPHHTTIFDLEIICTQRCHVPERPLCAAAWHCRSLPHHLVAALLDWYTIYIFTYNVPSICKSAMSFLCNYAVRVPFKHARFVWWKTLGAALDWHREKPVQRNCSIVRIVVPFIEMHICIEQQRCKATGESVGLLPPVAVSFRIAAHFSVRLRKVEGCWFAVWFSCPLCRSDLFLYCRIESESGRLSEKGEEIRYTY